MTALVRTPAAPARARAAGARPTRDAARTQAAILDAATREFAQHGLGGARVDRIAALAEARTSGCSTTTSAPRRTCSSRCSSARTSTSAARSRSSTSRTCRPPRASGELVAFTWNYYLAHPEFITLLNSENLHRARHLKRSRKIRALHSPLVATLSEVLERGVRAGVFRRGVDPVQLYVSIAALGYFYLSNNHTLSTIFGRDLMTRQGEGGAPRAHPVARARIPRAMSRRRAARAGRRPPRRGTCIAAPATLS